jgi:hypothetical protein
MALSARGPLDAAPQRAVARLKLADPARGRRGPPLGRGEIGRVIVIDGDAGIHAERAGRLDHGGGIVEAKRSAPVASAEHAGGNQLDPGRRIGTDAAAFPLAARMSADGECGCGQMRYGRRAGGLDRNWKRKIASASISITAGACGELVHRGRS